jgi:hypothetical protein
MLLRKIELCNKAQLTESQSNEINKLREDMESKFQQILLKVNVDKILKRE